MAHNSSKSAFTILDGVPSVTTDRLYNDSGILYFNGSAITSTSGVLPVGTLVGSMLRWDGSNWVETSSSDTLELLADNYSLASSNDITIDASNGTESAALYLKSSTNDLSLTHFDANIENLLTFTSTGWSLNSINSGGTDEGYFSYNITSNSFQLGAYDPDYDFFFNATKGFNNHRATLQTKHFSDDSMTTFTLDSGTGTGFNLISQNSAGTNYCEIDYTLAANQFTAAVYTGGGPAKSSLALTATRATLHSSTQILLSGLVRFRSTAIDSTYSPYTLEGDICFILALTNAGAVTVKLLASPVDDGTVLYIMREGAYDVTIDGNGKNINGSPTYTMTANGVVQLMCGGMSDWYTV